jgi:hypothetical protein
MLMLRPALALASLLLLAACGGSDTPPSGADGAAEIEIADGRTLGMPTDDAPPALPADDVMAPVLAAARAHWQSADPAYEEDAQVLAVAEGAFTEAGASQRAVLYVMSLWPRCCPKMGLAVLEGDAPVRNLAFEGTFQDLRAVPDLTGDGLDDLVAMGTFGMGGQNSTSASVFSLAGGSMASLGGVSLREDGCAGSATDGGMAQRVTARPGAAPSFFVETFTRATCESETWDASGPAAPLTMEGGPFEAVALAAVGA